MAADWISKACAGLHPDTEWFLPAQMGMIIVFRGVAMGSAVAVLR
jgi:hypothetical protein